MARFLSLTLIFSFVAATSFAQIRDVPQVVKTSFEKQYPNADSVEYKDNLVSVSVNFIQGGEKMMATYNNKGAWKGTEKRWDYEKLTPEIHDGFDKSKYSTDWKITEADILYLPDGSEQYRLKVEKNDIQKKYLYFDKSGRMLKDSITM
jgi:hypothetical protein